MLFRYIAYLYNRLKGYIYKSDSEIQYNIPFDNTIIQEYDINKTIFAINNMPDIIHKILFESSQISPNYYYIRLNIKSNEINHNLTLDKDIENKDIRYIFIRLNLINEDQYFHHVNGIYIDKIKKYILVFEPKFELSFDKSIIENLFNNDYKFLYAEDIGYTNNRRMQNHDLFCQTYVLFSFILIIYNNDISYTEYYKMFSTVINSKNIDHMLYWINNILIKNNYEICEQPELWSCNKFKNINNMIKYILNKKLEKEDISNLNIIEKDDITIIENLM